jgi:protein-disulfide isomerase
MTHRTLLPLLLMGLLAAGQAHAQDRSLPAAGGAFTPAQRAEIVAILRDALRNDPSILRDAVTALQADEQRRQSDSASNAIAANRAALVADARDAVAGNPAGDVTLVEFYDPRCPYCRAMLPTMAALEHADPQLRVVFKDLPILGPASVLETRALLAAQRQGGYTKLQAALMQAPPDATEDLVRTQAQAVGLDWPRLQHDMADPTVSAQIDANLKLAQALGIQGTPALIVGRQMIPGEIGLADLRQVIAGVRSGQ